MSHRKRLILGTLFFGLYLFGLGMAGISAFLAAVIGPWDSFAATVILVPGLVGLAGAVGIVKTAGPERRALAVILLVAGALWIAASAWIVSLYASIGL